jgi:uncharacterized small protein (DUF1192 family)
MPTENQARRAMQGAMEYEAKKWQMVVAELQQTIADLQQRVAELETKTNKGDK